MSHYCCKQCGQRYEACVCPSPTPVSQLFGERPSDQTAAQPVTQVRPRYFSTNGWLEAAVAWETCASIHQKFAGGRDALFSTRRKDFLSHAEDSRRLATSVPAPGPTANTASESITARGAIFKATELKLPGSASVSIRVFILSRNGRSYFEIRQSTARASKAFSILDYPLRGRSSDAALSAGPFDTLEAAVSVCEKLWQDFLTEHRLMEKPD